MKVEEVIDLTLVCDDTDAPPSKRQRSLHEEEPHELRCPISQTMFRDPVMVCASGHTYERQAIQKWFQTHDTDPMTRKYINDKAITTNWAIRKSVERWLEDNPELMPDGWDSRAMLLQQHTQPDIVSLAKKGDVEGMTLALHKGAAVDAKDKYGETALHIAALFGRESIAKLLLKAGAAVDAKGPDPKRVTPLHIATRNGDQPMAKLLLENGAAVDAKYEIDYETPLHVASHKQDLPMAKLLLENGAAVDAKGPYDCTPLHVASHWGYQPMAKLLLENGAAVDAKDRQGWTPLHWAALAGYDVVAKLLIENRAAVDAKDEYYATALHLAAQEGHEPMIKLLLENGAVEAKDIYDKTAFEWASENGHESVANLLCRSSHQKRRSTVLLQFPLSYWTTDHGRSCSTPPRSP